LSLEGWCDLTGFYSGLGKDNEMEKEEERFKFLKNLSFKGSSFILQGIQILKT